MSSEKKERRWYVEYKSPLGITRCVMITHDGQKFPWPKERGAITKEVEMSEAFWHLSLEQVIAYHRDGIKPTVRVATIAHHHV